MSEDEAMTLMDEAWGKAEAEVERIMGNIGFLDDLDVGEALVTKFEDWCVANGIVVVDSETSDEEE